MSQLPWAIASRPKTVKDYAFQDAKQKARVEQWIAEGNIPNLLFSGHRGTGKTSLAYLLKNELKIEDEDFMMLNASDENSVETIRSKVKSFISNYAASEFKLVFLDEADYLSQNAQAVLRNMMEDYADNARFILTCNKPHKIIPELKSRSQEFMFNKLDKEELVMKVVKILRKFGGHKVTDEDVDKIVEYVNQSYPDFRKIINNVEANFVDGALNSPSEVSEADEWKAELLGMMDEGNWDKIRTYMSANISDDQWEEVYRTMYSYLGEIAPFNIDRLRWDHGIITIADYLYKNSLVADQEINFAACIIKLSHLTKDKT